ncbi:phosphotransferase [Actinomyces bowdenii]|uniref:Phosphotransferase n=2 Tax=Actinomyces bowdenii TaxID=131109 RepID=A0A853ELT2_9ACTO|nr:phosphotransferase [Actinomyces bowdenii]NYS70293.1 phosphotransferase [Actinomyces bowdenii]
MSSMTTPSAPEAPQRPATGALTWPQDGALLEALGPWLLQRRWFPLKGAAAPAPGSLSIVASWEPAPGVRHLLIAAPRSDEGGQAPVIMQVPLVLEEAGALEGFATPGQAPGSHGLVLQGPHGALALVDGAHHPAFWRAWAAGALEAGTVLDEQGAQAIAQRADRLRVTTGEQSNTSVVLPAPRSPQEAGGPQDAATGDLIVKLLRVLAHGRNPDVEVSVALARQGWDRVRRPVAWSALSWTMPDGSQAATDSAVACAFIPKAEDGFELFCELATQDDGAGPVRRRAEELAEDLGRTTAHMHDHLAAALGAEQAQSPTELATALRARAEWATAEVPELSRRLPDLGASIERALGSLEALEALEPATRVHGDYHLGQVLREVGGAQRWYVLDFEGEPLRPLAQRSRPDQPLRDLAGMLRSLDYADAVGRAARPDWLPAMRAALTRGYEAERPARSAQERRARATVLTCLELDKALYEAVYEARNRPDWLGIPVAGIASLMAAEAAHPGEAPIDAP